MGIVEDLRDSVLAATVYALAIYMIVCGVWTVRISMFRQQSCWLDRRNVFNTDKTEERVSSQFNFLGFGFDHHHRTIITEWKSHYSTIEHDTRKYCWKKTANMCQQAHDKQIWRRPIIVFNASVNFQQHIPNDSANIMSKVLMNKGMFTFAITFPYHKLTFGIIFDSSCMLMFSGMK